jgi:hypothetical protein
VSTPERTPQQRTEFEAQAEQGSSSLLAELVQFLRENKKWWLIPVVVSLLLIGLLVFLGGTVAAPFIYTLW